MENTSAIQVSIGNIVKASYHLAEKCRPLLEDLVHAQRITDLAVDLRRERRGEGDEEEAGSGGGSGIVFVKDRYGEPERGGVNGSR
jgi:hypothetical protein